MTWQDDHAADAERFYWFGVRIDFSTPLLLTNAPFDIELEAGYGGTAFDAETFLASTMFTPDQFANTEQGQQISSVTIGNADGVIGTLMKTRPMTNRAPRVDIFRFWFNETDTLKLVWWLLSGRLDAPTGDAVSHSFSVRPSAESPVSKLPSIEMGSRCGVVSFKDAICGYAGAELTCDRTPARCIALSNIARFQGYLNLPAAGQWFYPVGADGPGFQVQGEQS